MVVTHTAKRLVVRSRHEDVDHGNPSTESVFVWWFDNHEHADKTASSMKSTAQGFSTLPSGKGGLAAISSFAGLTLAPALIKRKGSPHIHKTFFKKRDISCRRHQKM